MAEGARLLIECMGDCTGGSNPPHSVLSKKTVNLNKKGSRLDGKFYVVSFDRYVTIETSQRKKTCLQNV